MNKLMLVTAAAFVWSVGAASATPLGSQLSMTKGSSAIVQIKYHKKPAMKGGKKNMKGMKGMDHSKMKM